MAILAELQCTVCQEGEPPLTDDEIKDLMENVPEWHVIDDDGVKKLRRSFKFEDFLTALVFTNDVGRAADDAGHHPILVIEWGKVTVTWWTHKIHGLHQNDFIMAAKTDQFYPGEKK